jgi:hypothetical protein
MKEENKNPAVRSPQPVRVGTGEPVILGSTTTQTRGFGKNTVSGTGLTDQKTITPPKQPNWYMLKPEKKQ